MKSAQDQPGHGKQDAPGSASRVLRGITANVKIAVFKRSLWAAMWRVDQWGGDQDVVTGNPN